MEQRVRLWDAINRYVETCGGNPSKHVYGNTRRMTAVAEVEQIVRDVESEEREACATVAHDDECRFTSKISIAAAIRDRGAR